MVALNTRRAEAMAWAPPLGEVTTLVATTTGTWPAGTRMVVGDSTDTIATGTVLGAAAISVDGLTATWALDEAQCAILRAHTRLLVQVPSGAAWDGVLAGAIAREPVWSGARSVQTIGAVLVGPQGPPGIGADPETIGVAVQAYLAAHPMSAPVQSVAGRTGAITLAVADVSGAVASTDGRLSDPRTPTAHKATHATGGGDALTPADIGAATAAQGALAASASQPGHTHTLDATTDTATRLALTPAERTKLTNTSGTNTGDQTLPTWTTLAGKPAVIAAGADAAAARTAIGAGTSSLVLGTGAGDAKAGNYAPPDATASVKGLMQLAGDLAGSAAAPTVVAASETVAGKVELATTAEATTGTDTARAVTPAGLKAVADTKAPTLGADDNYVTDAEKTALGSLSTTYASISGQFAVNAVAASGATETLPVTHAAHKVTMDANCTFTFTSPTAGHAFILLLLGAFTPTWPASVDWAGGTAPTYASAGTLYHFATLDGGTTWLGSGQAYS